MEKQNKKFRRYFKRNKHSKKYKISKESNFNIQKLLKIICILIMIIVFCLKNKKEMNLINNNNNNWMKKNMSEFIMKYFSTFKGNYNERVKRDIIRLKQYFSLKVIIKEGNLTLNLEAKEKLKNELKKQHKTILIW